MIAKATSICALFPKLSRNGVTMAMPLPSMFVAPKGTNQNCQPQLQHRHRTTNILLRSLFYVKRTKISEHSKWYNAVPADGFVLDLEDAVPYDKKLETRTRVADVLNRLPQTDLPHMLVRINSLNDDHADADWRDDIEATAHKRLLAYIVPKARHPDEIQEVSAFLTKCEKEYGMPIGHHKLIALIETADGVRKSYDIAKSDNRLIAMTVGRFDLINSLKCGLDSALMKHACNDVAIAARAANVTPLLSANCDLENHSAFERECAEAKNLGYAGRSTLTIKQARAANRFFMIKSDEAEEAAKILHSSHNGSLAKTSQGRMVGPPHKKEAASLLKRFDLQSVYDKEKEIRLSADSNLTSTKTLTTKRFSSVVHNASDKPTRPRKNEKLVSPFEITINEGVRTFWEQHFFPISKLNTSSNFAKSMGFKDVLVPFSLLANWAMSLSVMSFSIKAIVHLELTGAIQHSPVYYGDTIINEVTVIDVDQKKQGYDIVSSHHSLVRLEDGQTVFSALKKTMFPRGVFPKTESREQPTEAIENIGTLLDSAKNLKSISRALRGHSVCKDQLYVHDLVKSFGPSDAINLSYYLKGVNPLHINNQFKHEQLLVSGPCVVAATIANHGFDFGDIFDEKWSNFLALNKTLNNDLISTISYVQDVRPFFRTGESSPLEEITLKVAGVKNINPDVLAKLNFPAELFLESMKPSDFEKVCSYKIPELSHKVVCLGTRTIVRCRPNQ